MLRKLASTAGLTVIALTLLGPAAVAAEPAQADMSKYSSLGAVVSTTTSTGEETRYRTVSFSQQRSSGSSASDTINYFESVFSGGMESYNVTGSLTGQQAAAAFTIKGLTVGELHAVIPVKICSYDSANWTETCVDGGTRQVDVTVTAELGGLDRVKFPPIDDPNCTDVCLTMSSTYDSRPATAELVVDGIPATDVAATLLRAHESVRVLIRPALSTHR